MTEQDLVQKLKLLQDVKPNPNWVVLAKKRVFAENELSALAPAESRKSVLGFLLGGAKFALSRNSVFALVCLLIAGAVALTLNSLPGRSVFLGIQKAITKNSPIVNSGNKDPKASLEQANQQLAVLLEKLTAGESQENLAVVINNYKSTVSEAARNLANEKDQAKLKELVTEVKKLEDKEELMRSLGIQFEENYEKDLALVQLISEQVKILERKELSKENRARLLQVKDFAVNGYFVEALDLILLINNSD